MKTQPSRSKKRFAFAVASMFEGSQSVTWFDHEGNPIRRQRKAKKQPRSVHGQTSLL